MEEHYTQGPNLLGRLVSGIGASLPLVAGGFILSWIATGNVQTAAIIVLGAIGVLVLVAAPMASGMFMMYLGNRGIIQHLTEALLAKGREQAIPGTSTPVNRIPLRGNELVSIGDSQMVRQEQIDRTATKVYIRMFPHTSPSRDNIKKNFRELTSDGFIQKVQMALVEQGVARGGGVQGKEYVWVINEEDY